MLSEMAISCKRNSEVMFQLLSLNLAKKKQTQKIHPQIDATPMFCHVLVNNFDIVSKEMRSLTVQHVQQ